MRYISSITIIITPLQNHPYKSFHYNVSWSEARRKCLVKHIWIHEENVPQCNVTSYMRSGIKGQKLGGIREQRPGILRSQAAGSGSIVFRGDQGFSILTENVEMRFNRRDLPPFKNLSCIFSLTICSGTNPYVTRFAGQAWRGRKASEAYIYFTDRGKTLESLGINNKDEMQYYKKLR